jgi:hypothetical protein
MLRSPFGSLAVYSLSDGLLLEGDGVNYGVGFRPRGDVLPAGTRLRARMLLVGMHRKVSDPAGLAAKIVQDYGIRGPAAYKFAVVAGTAGAADYPASLQAGNEGCFRGTLTGVAGMAGNVAVAVSGLCDRWTAFCQSVGASAGDVKTRLSAVEAGTGYAVLRDEDEGRSIFLGHPLLADKPEVILSVTRSRDGKDWTAEIHNPSDAALTVAVRSNPHVSGLAFAETLTLPAGASVIRRLGRSAVAVRENRGTRNGDSAPPPRPPQSGRGP